MIHHPYRHTTHLPRLGTFTRCIDCGRRMHVAAIYSTRERAPRYQRGWVVCPDCLRSDHRAAS
jgi:hypothetical protein